MVGRRRGVITKRHSSVECSTKGHEKRALGDHGAVLARRYAPGFPHSRLFHCQITDEGSSAPDGSHDPFTRDTEI